MVTKSGFSAIAASANSYQKERRALLRLNVAPKK
jgi:hypothetical protein